MTRDEGLIHQLAESIMFRLVRHPEKLPKVLMFETDKAAKMFMDEIRRMVSEAGLPKGTVDVVGKLVRRRPGH